MLSAGFRGTFLRALKFLQIKEGGDRISGGTNSAESLDDLVPSSVFQF